MAERERRLYSVRIIPSAAKVQAETETAVIERISSSSRYQLIKFIVSQQPTVERPAVTEDDYSVQFTVYSLQYL